VVTSNVHLFYSFAHVDKKVASNSPASHSPDRYKQSKFIDKLKFDNMYWIEITQYVVNNLSDNEKLEQIQEMQNKTGFNSGE
jgi:hypothetical protein